MTGPVASRSRLIPVVLALLAALCWVPQARGFEKVKVGDVLPAFALKDGAGATVSLADFKDKALVVVFLNEGANAEGALRQVVGAAKRLGEKGVALLGVSFGKDGAGAAKALGAEGADFPLLAGTVELYGVLGVKALPTTIVVDQAGRIVREISLNPPGLGEEVEAWALVALGEKTAAETELARRPQEAKAESAEVREAKKIYGMAKVLLDRGMNDKAAARLREAVALAPGLCEAHALLGRACLEDGKTEEAVAAYTAALKCDPTSDDAREGLRKSLAKRAAAATP